MDGNREWETLIECVSATGNRLPAFYIYAGTAHHAGWHEEANGLAPDTVFAYTDNGWTKNYIGLSGPRTISEHSLSLGTRTNQSPPRELRPLRHRYPPLSSQIGHLTAAAQAPLPSLDEATISLRTSGLQYCCTKDGS